MLRSAAAQLDAEAPPDEPPPAAQEPLLRAPPVPAAHAIALPAHDDDDAAAADERRGCGGALTTGLGFAFLTLNSGLAIRRSWDDPAAIVFVVFSYLDLVLLFLCLRWYEGADPESALRRRLKAAVWVLTSALTVAFSYKVAAIMPLAVALLVWTLAFATIAGGFYGLFLYEEKQ